MPRDFTESQFRAALRRNGFEKHAMWASDTSGSCPGVMFGLVVDAKSRRILRRESLARVIRARELHASKHSA